MNNVSMYQMYPDTSFILYQTNQNNVSDVSKYIVVIHQIHSQKGVFYET